MPLMSFQAIVIATQGNRASQALDGGLPRPKDVRALQ